MEPSLQAARTAADVDLSRFAIGFDQRDRARLHALWDEVSTPQRWSEGPLTERFEAAWDGWNGAGGGRVLAAGRAPRWPRSSSPACAARRCSARRTRSWPRRSPRCTPAARGRVRRLQPRGPLHVLRRLRGARSSATGPRAAFLVHIGGHIAFDVERIAALCRERGHLPDRGLRPRPRRRLERRAGRAAGATPASSPSTPPRRSPPARAGCSSRATPELLEFARAFRNYGKPDHAVARAELPHERVHRRARARADRAARGDRGLEERVGARAPRPGASRAASSCPDGMISGLYKYIVFDPIERSTGKVYDEPCHRILGTRRGPAEHRLGGREPLVRAALLPAGRRRGDGTPEGARDRRIRLHRLARGRPADRRRARRRASSTSRLALPRREVETALGSSPTRTCWTARVAGCDAVVHLAAVADVNHVHKGPSGAESVNVRGTANVLDAARAARAWSGWSTAARPGSTATAEARRSTRTRRCAAAAHLYTATKLAGELYCKVLRGALRARRHDPALRHPLRAAGARGRRGAGVRRQGAAGEPLTLPASGEQSRNFVYVEDLAEGVVAALGARPAAASTTSPIPSRPRSARSPRR